jgi:hypothetical protein
VADLGIGADLDEWVNPQGLSRFEWLRNPSILGAPATPDGA